MVPMSNAAHPVWALLRLAVVVGGLAIVLALCAREFDETELKTIGWMFLAMLGYETLTGVGQRFMKPVTDPKNLPQGTDEDA